MVTLGITKGDKNMKKNQTRENNTNYMCKESKCRWVGNLESGNGILLQGYWT